MEKKKFVRAEKITVQEAVPGMVLAEDVKSEGGGVILTAESLLTRQAIDRMLDMGIYYVSIEKYSAPKQYDVLRDKKAVVVADSLSFRHMFAKMLYQIGMFVCEELETGGDCLKCATSHKPHLVVIDLDLPDCDSLELLKKMRKQFKDTKLLAVSASKDKDTVINAIKSGAHDFMLKPINWELLKPRLMKMFDGDNHTDQTSH